MFRMDDVFVVEAAFSGPRGFPLDRVIEVSVCRMHKDGNDFDTLYDSFVFADPMDLGKDSLDFIQENYGITAETLYASPEEETVVKELREKLGDDAECTSFNVNRTFGQFLCVEPWDLNGEVTLLPSISSRLPPEYSNSLKDAYDYVTPGNPMGIEGKTSMDNCLMATSIMMKLRQTGFFRSHPEHADVHVRSEERQQEQKQVEEQHSHAKDALENRQDRLGNRGQNQEIPCVEKDHTNYQDYER